MKDKTTAAILALILGGLGVHKFYLGQYGMGFLYLLFCWTFVPAIIALVEFIQFLSMTDEAFNAKYNNGPIAAPAPSGRNVAEEIGKLHELKQSGALTEEEFSAQKAALLR